MDLSRILSVLCLFLLAICLVFSVTALTALRNAVNETDRMRSDAESLLEELKKQPQEPISPDEDKESVPVDILYESFCMRECGGKIAREQQLNSPFDGIKGRRQRLCLLGGKRREHEIGKIEIGMRLFADTHAHARERVGL